MLTPLGSYVELKAQQVIAATRHRVARSDWDEQTRGQGREGGDKGGMYNIIYIYTVYFYCTVYCILVLYTVYSKGFWIWRTERCGF